MLKNINFCLSIGMIFPSIILTLTNQDRSLAMAGYGMCLVLSLAFLLQQGRKWTYLQASCFIFYVATFAITTFVPLVNISLINRWSLWIVYAFLSSACFLPKYFGAKTFVEQYAKTEFVQGLPPLVVRLNILWGVTFLLLLSAAIFAHNSLRSSVTLALVCLSAFITKTMRKNYSYGK